MTDAELIEHLEYVDGLMLAQDLVLRALLKQRPEVVSQLHDYFTYFEKQELYEELSQVTREAFRRSFFNLLGPARPRP